MQSVRPTSSSTINTSFFEFDSADAHQPSVYRAASASASSAATSYMQSNYEFQFVYEGRGMESIAREHSHEPLHLDKSGYTDEAGSSKDVDEDGAVDSHEDGNDEDDEDDDAYVDPSARRGW